jgi:gluconolactonase
MNKKQLAALAALPVAALALAAALPSSAQQTANQPLADILEPNARVERVGSGFKFIEGPVWSPQGQLFFSDIPAETIYLYTLASDSRVYGGRRLSDKFEIFRHPSG